MKQTGQSILHMLMFFLYSSIICSPKLTIVLVIDNLSHTAFERIVPHIGGGIAFIANNGFRYEQAFWPHAFPSTAPGHTGLVSGTVPAQHGIIDNAWFDANGNKVACDDDTPEHAAVFSPDGFYSYGKSAHNIMVDTLADQLLLHNKTYKVFSLSLKSRAAIAMAGTLGKALWYDDEGHQFTSSKAYFSTLPLWVDHVNQSLQKATEKPWVLFFEKNAPAYAHAQDTTYDFAREKSLINQPVTPDTFEMTPAATTALIKLAQACLMHEGAKDTDEHFLLLLSISSTDKVFHHFGPDSFEYLDMLYHLDHDLKSLVNTAFHLANPQDVLFILTADHGGMPLAEHMQQQGYDKALRINTEHLKATINEHIYKKFKIQHAIRHIDAPQIYLNHTMVPATQKKNILRTIKQLVKQQPGIKKVWTLHELQRVNFCIDTFTKHFKQQLFTGRSGDIIFQVFPYVYASKYDKGTGHSSPYAYDTHVPLIMYQKGILESKKIVDTVWIPQVAPTLAYLLGAPKPSAATFGLLPCILY